MNHPILSFFLIAVVLTITPGADTFLVMRNTIRGGRADGWATTSGICLGTLVHATLSALGLSVILTTSAAAFAVVKLAGAAYLIWLGTQSFRKGSHSMKAVSPATGSEPVTPRKSFSEGLLTNLLNPKVAIFYLAFLPQFIRPGDPVLAMSLLLALIHAVLGLIWLGTIAVALERGAHLTGDRFRLWMSRVSGCVLTAFGVRLAMERR